MIFCIIGKSATGKDSVFSKLLEKDKSLNKILTYTTRPMRDNEKLNKDYIFVDNDYLSKIENNIIEKRVYNTVHGDWTYATIDDGNIKNDMNYVVIATLESYNSLKKYFGDENVYPIYLEIPEDIRIKRAEEREKLQKNPRFEEMRRRLLADQTDFSEENIKSANIAKKYINIDLDKCVDEIYMDILKNKC